MTLLLTATPWIPPVLRVGRKQKSKTDETDWHRSDEHQNRASRQSAKAKQDLLSDTHFEHSRGAGLSTQTGFAFLLFFHGCKRAERDFRPLVRPADDRDDRVRSRAWHRLRLSW